jgi:hypothetical protein
VALERAQFLVMSPGTSVAACCMPFDVSAKHRQPFIDLFATDCAPAGFCQVVLERAQFLDMTLDSAQLMTVLGSLLAESAALKRADAMLRQALEFFWRELKGPHQAVARNYKVHVCWGLGLFDWDEAQALSPVHHHLASSVMSCMLHEGPVAGVLCVHCACCCQLQGIQCIWARYTDQSAGTTRATRQEQQRSVVHDVQPWWRGPQFRCQYSICCIVFVMGVLAFLYNLLSARCWLPAVLHCRSWER